MAATGAGSGGRGRDMRQFSRSRVLPSLPYFPFRPQEKRKSFCVEYLTSSAVAYAAKDTFVDLLNQLAGSTRDTG